jgi:hypothetical protein
MKHFMGLASVLFAFFLVSTFAAAQSAPDITVSAYADTYYATDNDVDRGDDVVTNRKFSFVNPRKDHFGLNIGQISVSADADMYRGMVTMHWGDLRQTAYGGILQQAWGGFQLFNDFWVDAGYFLTHIGGEALLPKDNWLSSHSLVTFYEPFYHSGLRMTYDFSDNFSGQLHIMNGSGIFGENNFNKSLGLYLGYSSDNEDFTLSYAGTYGNEIDGAPYNAKLHMYHNVCAGFKVSDNFETKAQLDLAQLEDGTIDDNGEPTQASFMGASLQGRYHFSEKSNATLRFAWIDDSDAIYSENMAGYSGIGLTAGVEYKPVSNGYIRLEGRMISLSGDDDAGKIFYDGSEITNSRMEVALNFGLWLN